MQMRLLARTDFILLVAVLLLCAYGALMIYSCTQAQLAMADKPPASTVTLQLIWIGLGLVVMGLIIMVDYSRIASLSLVFYGLVLGLLLLVIAVGQATHGSARWLAIGSITVQPSELAKLAIILMLGAYLSSHSSGQLETFHTLARSLGYVMVPAALIVLQPDLGTPVVLLFIWFFVVFLAGARLTQLGAVAFAFAMLFAIAWSTGGVILPYHKERLTAFLNPDEDPQGAGWQIRQSLIAIGSGHLLGKGLFQGTQSRLEFIPHQEKDFVFTVVGEEWGFAGCLALLGLLAVLLWRSLAICWQAKDKFGRLVAGGIAAMFLIHITANVGMTLGLAPVKGMTLPFVSYGGSSMIVNCLAVGILQNIYMRKRKIAF